MSSNIVNIINFIRANEPDTLRTLQNEVNLVKRYNLPSTWLIEYDALIKPEYTGLLKERLSANDEIGVWIEIVHSLTDKAGVKWRGDPDLVWDWHSDADLAASYEPEERERLMDVLMEDFKTVFGKYPASAGAWVLDAHTISYLADKYGIEACCNCKDQWGTDGYTLWGGYCGPAYYPSRFNAFTPAQTTENQISVPVFRMLGSDPIYQYDTGLDEKYNPTNWQQVITLEPVSGCGGGSPDWVKWFFQENFSELSSPFGYTQVGQENSFGWDLIQKGLENQIEFIADKAAKGELNIQTLADTGRAFKKSYTLTPASVVAARSDWKNEGNQSFWYCSRFYRINLFFEKDRLWIRDFYLFDEMSKERYLTESCVEKGCVYDNLPVMDGNRWSGNGCRAGIYPVKLTTGRKTVPFAGEKPQVRTDGEHMDVLWPLLSGGTFVLHCNPGCFEMNLQGSQEEWKLQFTMKDNAYLSLKGIERDVISLCHHGYAYRLNAGKGQFIRSCDGSLSLVPSENKLEISLA